MSNVVRKRRLPDVFENGHGDGVVVSVLPYLPYLPYSTYPTYPTLPTLPTLLPTLTIRAVLQ